MGVSLKTVERLNLHNLFNIKNTHKLHIHTMLNMKEPESDTYIDNVNYTVKEYDGQWQKHTLSDRDRDTLCIIPIRSHSSHLPPGSDP